MTSPLYHKATAQSSPLAYKRADTCLCPDCYELMRARCRTCGARCCWRCDKLGRGRGCVCVRCFLLINSGELPHPDLELRHDAKGR